MSEIEPTTNPLILKMKKIIPSTTIRLPSKGMFYKHGELDASVVDGEIIVYPMTTLDEITIRGPDMLYQGTAIEQVVGRCAPQVKKTLDLLAKDVDYILVQLRKVSYGDNILLKFTCPTCAKALKDDETAMEHEYSMSIDYFINKTKELNVSDLQKYTITLQNGMVLNLRPSRFGEMLKMNQGNDDGRSPEEYVEIINTSILSVIQDVDGVDDGKQIKEWLKILPVKSMEEILSKIAEANNFGPEFKYSLKCKDCGTEHDISYILNPVSFFMLPSSPKTDKN